jgi:hypothetical protein
MRIVLRESTLLPADDAIGAIRSCEPRVERRFK